MVYFLVITTSIFVMCTNSGKENGQDGTQEQTSSPTEEEKPENRIAEQDTIKGSIPSEASGSIGPANIKITIMHPV